ncbi:MAG: trypsin-like serine protease [Planctomycetota bacterium]
MLTSHPDASGVVHVQVCNAFTVEEITVTADHCLSGAAGHVALGNDRCTTEWEFTELNGASFDSRSVHGDATWWSPALSSVRTKERPQVGTPVKIVGFGRQEGHLGAACEIQQIPGRVVNPQRCEHLAATAQVEPSSPRLLCIGEATVCAGYSGSAVVSSDAPVAVLVAGDTCSTDGEGVLAALLFG